MIRSAIRGLLKVADAELAAELRGLLHRDDDYAGAGKPVCDYDDPLARAALVDALARDALALVAALDGRGLAAEVDQAGQLLAGVVGQDRDQDHDDGVFGLRIGSPGDRVISSVDPDARHGHKTSARGCDGYKGHIAIDPDVEIVTATVVTAGNAGDAEPAADLLTDDLPTDTGAGEGGQNRPAVFGDAAYGAGKPLSRLETAGAQIFTRVQPPTAPGGRFAKDRFTNLAAGTVTWPEPPPHR